MEAAGRNVIVCVYQDCKLICSSRWFFSTVLVGIKTFTWSTSVRYSKTPNSHTDPKPAGCHYCWPMLAFGSFSPHCYKCFSFALFLSFVPAWQSLSRDKTFQTDSDGNQVFKGHRWGCLRFFCDPCVCPRLLLQEKTCVFVPEPKVQSVKGRKVKASNSFWIKLFFLCFVQKLCLWSGAGRRCNHSLHLCWCFQVTHSGKHRIGQCWW